MYTLKFSEEQMEFLRQLAQSQIPITMQAAKVAAEFQDTVLRAKPDMPAADRMPAAGSDGPR